MDVVLLCDPKRVVSWRVSVLYALFPQRRPPDTLAEAVADA
jgi:hypothetical protein